MKGIVSIVASATLLATMACALERTEVRCPRPESIEELMKSANIITSFTNKSDAGIYFVKITPGSFWACAGIQEGDLITALDSTDLSDGLLFLKLLEQIIQGAALELSVQNSSGNRRVIAVR